MRAKIKFSFLNRNSRNQGMTRTNMWTISNLFSVISMVFFIYIIYLAHKHIEIISQMKTIFSYNYLQLYITYSLT